jgi:hypothetical protein
MAVLPGYECDRVYEQDCVFESERFSNYLRILGDDWGCFRFANFLKVVKSPQMPCVSQPLTFNLQLLTKNWKQTT